MFSNWRLGIVLLERKQKRRPITGHMFAINYQASSLRRCRALSRAV